MDDGDLGRDRPIDADENGFRAEQIVMDVASRSIFRAAYSLESDLNR
jgi:hypothetical protein